MIKILYVSALCSEKVLDNIYETSINKPEQAAQKFHRLLAKGFALQQQNCCIETLSTLPVVPANHKRKIWNLPSETINKLKFRYIPFINLPYIKNSGIFCYTFIKVFLWTLSIRKKNKVVICDVLNLTVSLASFWAARLTGATCVAIVTDLPGLMVTTGGKKDNTTRSLYHTMVSTMMQGFDRYILLTEQMNEIVNPKNKPYIIMEGLVDLEMEASSNILDKKNTNKKVLIYAGGLYAKYGIKDLIEAFMLLENVDVELHLYGSGEMVTEMDAYMRKDQRIHFKGMVPNKIVVKDQLAATLLINPRPTNEEFTKFSFPSKNMEYMVSGTPMITTKLPGMPKEYYPYVYLFEEENVEGMKNTLQKILSKSKEDLHQFGLEAKKFVLTNKNNQIQAQRILQFLKENA
ncbi:glycosyltransferase [Arenibacter sp. BSSL-BM3]|uniref:Glycosyltransferase n=1 Tax=Arenibacter arenosicollis TaxID=2762274 RepID=A0ABR7QL19_9FLAO|nr:glycosyltransferase [Arenibacter arenosicollis]MBC8767870.1 glycosyltransferase [Arenibacter arenosicollis]